MGNTTPLIFIWSKGKLWIIFTTCFSVLSGCTPFITLQVSKNLINSVSELFQHKSYPLENVVTLLLIQIGIAIFTTVLSSLREYIDKVFFARFDHDLQQMVLEKSSSVPLYYYDKLEFVNYLGRVNSGRGHIVGVVRAFFNVVESIIGAISYLSFLISVHWLLAVFCLLLSLPYFVVETKFGKKRYRLVKTLTPLTREINYLSYLLSDRIVAKEVRLFSLARNFITRWSRSYWENARHTLTLAKQQRTLEVCLESVSVLIYGGMSVLILLIAKSQLFSIGSFIAIGQALSGFQTSLLKVSSDVAKWYEDFIYIKDFFSFLEYQDRSYTLENGIDKMKFTDVTESSIVFDNVSFTYPQSARSVLDNISLRIESGETIAIVGENGSGKTTLIKCLMGLLPVTGGEIQIGGISIDSLDHATLWRKITVVFQDFVRYSFTVSDNIAFGDVDNPRDEARIREVAELCGVNSFVQKFTDRYETFLGRFLKNGEDLSGGQWQKLALARAFYRDSPIVVLDEPTAAIDPQSEIELFDLFTRLPKRKTVILISHRMSAARLADRIVVMKEGRIVEMGTHEELIALGAEYSSMFYNQAEWYTYSTEQQKEMAI